MFVAGIAISIFTAAVHILLIIAAPFLFISFFALSVITYPFTLLARHLGYPVRSFYSYCLYLWQKRQQYINGPFETARLLREKELRKKSGREQQQSRSKVLAEKQETKFDPWKVLDLQPGASKEMISSAYRKKIMKNHPDKVAALDVEVQVFATQRTKLITQAYNHLI